MKFSHNWLEKFFKEKLPPAKELAELLSLRSFEVETVEKKASDFILDIDITANRVSDCSSHWGMAREIGAVLSLQPKNPLKAVKEKKGLLADKKVSIRIEAKDECSRYTARVIEGVRVKDSPLWLKKKIEACGLQPINNIVDAANYVMLDLGQPLHVFDLDKLDKKTIIVRHAKPKEKIITLDNQSFSLDKDVLVIADGKNPLALAGIKGGKAPAVEDKTRNLVLEAANFSPLSIRKTSQKLKLRTDASWRFEHGIDPNLTEEAIENLAELIQRLAGGKVAEGLVDYYPRKRKPFEVALDWKKTEQLLGTKISRSQGAKILKSLGFFLSGTDGEKIKVRVPTFRLDINLPEDLIEEVGRIYGYENISAAAPRGALVPPEKNYEVFWKEFSKDILKEAGFSEVYNYALTSRKMLDFFHYEPEEVWELANPLSENYQFLVPSLMINLLKNTKDNFRYFDEIKIFELNKIFKKRSDFFVKKKNLPKAVEEKRALTGVVASKNRKQEGFYEAKGAIDLLLEQMGMSSFWYDQHQATPEESKIGLWEASRSAEIKIDDFEIGFLGEISGRLLEKLKIKGKVAIFDLDFDKLIKLANEEHEYQPISPYPAATRDLALSVPLSVRVSEVLNIITAIGKEWLRDVDLFDIYEGEGLPENKKSFAFHLIYQAPDHTLSSEEIEELHQKIIKGLEENLEWEVRG